jgi:hypothetical protein
VRLQITLVLLLAAAVAPAARADAAPSCASVLPKAPGGLPAPIVFQTACGTYRAAENGAIGASRAVRSPWGSPSPFQVDVRAGHVVLIQRGKVRWRSRRRFTSPTSELESVAVGAGSLAFSFTHGRLWIARLGGHEHAVGWSEGALTWTRRGDLLTLQRRHRRWRLAARDSRGRDPRVIARAVRNFLVDDATRTVVYVGTSRSLVRTDGRSHQTLADLGSLGFDARATLQVLPRGMLGLSSPTRLAVLRADGSVFAAMTYPADTDGLKHGWPVFAPAGDRVVAAVELDRPAPGGTAGEDVYLLRAGDTNGTRLARLQDDWVGCGWLVSLAWHGPWLLYADSVADVLALDTDSGARIDLSATARSLPGVQLDESSGEYSGLDFAVWR